MAEAELFVALLVAVVLVALAVRRIERIPHAVALVMGGIVVGLLPFAPAIELDPEVIFVAFLPPILYPSALAFAAEDVRPALRPIAFLSIGLVVATMAAIGVAAHFAGGLPWAAAFVLGAVLAPTDPVAATAVIRSSGAPGRLATILEGESLINDGTALTALRIGIAAVGAPVSVGGAVGRFVLVAAGGAAVGAVLAWVTIQVRRRLDDLELESAIAVLLAYGAFILADRLGLSGVLAVVLAGFVMGRAEAPGSARSRLGGASFWSVAQFLAESILFLLVGLAFAQVLGDRATRSPGALAGLTALVVATAVGVRVAWMYSVPYAGRLLDRRGTGQLVDARGRAVLGFAGLRGALSVAAALSIPASVDGVGFPDRTTVVAVSIAAIVVLLVGPALALPAVLRGLRLTGLGDAGERERRARAALAEAALAGADELARTGHAPEDMLARVRARHEARLEQYAAHDDGSAPSEAARSELYRRLAAATIEAQRRRLSELRASGEVSGELLRRLERDLDLEEARIR